MAGEVRTVEQLVARLASRAHGVVTRRQLLDAGLSTDQIDARVRKGSLLPQYRGVYRVGHTAASTEARYTAAVLACGPRAVLSGLAAAHLYSLIRGPAPPPEVTAPTERRVKGVRTRRCRRLSSQDVACFRGIPVTTIPRTLTELAERIAPADLGRACHEADVRYGTTPEHVEAALARRPLSPGAAKLRRILHGDEPISLSRLESRLHQLLRENGLPLPLTNRRVGSYRLDCRWEQPPLTVELDGYRYHRSRHAWEQDRRREREARARGDDFRRYTWGDVFEHPAQTLAELGAVISPPW
jgi:very-short-patch-repair endonuclease